MTTLLVGKAPLTTIRHGDGSRSNLSRGAVVPASADKADVRRLLEEGYLEEIEIFDHPDEAPLVDEPVDEPVTEPVVAEPFVTDLTRPGDILNAVASDPVKATAYLDLEMTKPRPRPQLVTALEGIIEAGTSSAVTVPEGLEGVALEEWVSGDAVEGDELTNPERWAAYLARRAAADKAVTG